jgi:fructokinase
VCGEALVDLVPVGSSGGFVYELHAGGSPLNVAIGLSRLGQDTALLGAVSDDFLGRFLRTHLERNGVDSTYLAIVSHPTALALVHHTASGEPEFSFYGENSADRWLTPESVPAAFPPSVAAIHCGSISLARSPTAETIENLIRREATARVVTVDPNIRPSMIQDRQQYLRRIEAVVARAGIVKASRSDLGWLFPGRTVEKAALTLLGWGAGVVVVTCGAEGSLGLTREGWASAEAIPVSVVDTVGAGDAFTSGLLAHLAQSGLLTPSGLQTLSLSNLLDAMKLGAKVAALTCQRRGADLPVREEV